VNDLQLRELNILVMIEVILVVLMAWILSDVDENLSIN